MVSDNYEDTEWRQGHLLTDKDAAQLFTEQMSVGDSKVIIVSHDCDLPRQPSVEPVVEVIIGRLVNNTDGNFTSAKNARTLHLPFTGGTNKVKLAIEAPSKSFLSKELLLKITPESTISLVEEERNIFQVWLAARYRRAAFPNSFNARLKTKGIESKLARKLESYGEKLIGLYFDTAEIEYADGEGCHSLEIYVLYIDDGIEATFESIRKLVSEIDAIFKAAFLDQASKKWSGIELLDCIEISDHAMSVKLLSKLKRWNADHLSLRANPPQIVP